jgi:hypothetical protein
MAKSKKEDPFFTHLWDELTNAKILQVEGIAKWLDAPVKLQAQFIAAARKAMHAALGAAPRGKTKAKTKSKTKAKAKRKVAKKGAGSKAKTKAKPGTRS